MPSACPDVVPVPAVERDDVVDIVHGVAVADPYRYLEDPDSPRTAAFVTAQNAVSEPYLAELPSRAWFGRTVTDLLTATRSGTPWERGGRYFCLVNPGQLDQDQLVVADSVGELTAGGRILLDPNRLAHDGTVALTAAQVSPDGSLLAAALAEAGSDWQTIRVYGVASGTARPDVLQWAKWVAPTWLSDGSGFFYWRYPAPAGQEFTDAMGAGELVLHRLGNGQDQDVTVWSRPADRDWMVDPYVSPDGRWLALTAAPGTDSRTTVEVRRIVPGSAGPAVDEAAITVVGELAQAHRVVAILGDTLYLRTERDAPRGQLVAVDLAHPALPWTEVVGQHPTDVLADVQAAASGFVLVYSADAAHRIDVVDPDGDRRGELALPYPSAVVALHGRSGSDEVFVGFGSFTRRLEIRRLDLAVTPIDVAVVPSGDDVAGASVTAARRHATSTDGTAVPFTMVRRSDLPDGPRPTLLYGYGGFDIPVLPTFSALFSAWVRAGGVLAVANLRGGGEFGATWHEAGMKDRKQNVFDDLYACAEKLVADGITTPSQLAVYGRSNGGLLAGAALTQRPELWAAALPTVGVLDMLRFHLFTIGWAWTSDYGSPDVTEEFAVLRAYSPLHNVVEGRAYPATLICTGDHDDRVVPAHSLKFAAELQRGQGGGAPVLLRVDTRAGHGLGKPIHALADEYADQLAFAARHTGLEPEEATGEAPA
jgi:prolyl oligopeptidase